CPSPAGLPMCRIESRMARIGKCSCVSAFHARQPKTLRPVALDLLLRLLRHPEQHRAARFWHDPGGGAACARRAAPALCDARHVGALSRVWLRGRTRLLSRWRGTRPAIPAGALDRLEEGLATEPSLAVLSPDLACFRFPYWTSRRWLPAPPER